ncbi:asparagine synthase-related protein [Alteribacillus sp. JSM 102045]|uniref:asparagine synthase-related protein n=1 Tax=Alteribacillus sp. JSM 102045 TaxID=1562101 RepID=UPI0035BF7968
MYISAVVGSKENINEWKEILRIYISKNGYYHKFHTMKTTKSLNIYIGFCWFSSKEINQGELIEEYDNKIIYNCISLISNNNDFVFNKEKNEFSIKTPIASPEEIMYINNDNRFLVMSNDLRVLLNFSNRKLDSKGVYNLLKYGAFLPRTSLYKDIEKIPRGYESNFIVSDENITKIVFHPRKPLKTYYSEEQNLENDFNNTISNSIKQLPDNPVLYFSGGVDSSYIAAMFKEVGRDDVILFNYSFGDEDVEAAHAKDVARILDLPFMQEKFDERKILETINSLGKDYSNPFGDGSVLPTNMLINSSLESLNNVGVIIDGVGADGLLGMHGKITQWSKIYKVPNLFRNTISVLYKFLGVYNYPQDSFVEKIGRISRRSVQSPLSQASVMAQNPLDNIMYDIPPEQNNEFNLEINKYLHSFAEDIVDKSGVISLIDIMHTCAGEYASKTFSPLNSRGIRVFYPFLQDEIINLGLSSNIFNSEIESKSILKKYLENYLPKEFIYRKKSGFTPPYAKIFALSEIQAYFREVVLSEKNELTIFINKIPILNALDLLNKNKTVSVGVYNFLWVLFFTTKWMNEQK